MTGQPPPPPDLSRPIPAKPLSPALEVVFAVLAFLGLSLLSGPVLCFAIVLGDGKMQWAAVGAVETLAAGLLLAAFHRSPRAQQAICICLLVVYALLAALT